MLGGIMLYKKGKTVIGANWYGKMATVIFYFAILATIIFKMDVFINKYTTSAANISIGLAVLCTLFAFVMYGVIYVRISKNYHDSHSNTNI